MKYILVTTDTIDNDGTKRYYNKDNQLHRLDGPAIKYVNGTECWYQNGKCHRENNPSIIRFDGHKEWHKNGQLHREDGPAIEYANGTKEFWLEDELYSEREYNKLIKNDLWKKIKVLK